MPDLLPQKRINQPKNRRAVKEKQKIYCLYHETAGCDCIKPVIEIQTLKMRVENQLVIWRILYKFSGDKEKLNLIEKANKLKARFLNLLN